jgi:Family of unknown function (DUF6152)
MRRTLALMVAGLIAISAMPALAHHSVSPYDMAHPTTVVGVVVRVEWTNPHAYVYVKATKVTGGAEQSGIGEEWALEINSPNFLKHNGWTSETLKPGDTATFEGGRAKDGARTMRCTTVTLASGLVLRS